MTVQESLEDQVKAAIVRCLRMPIGADEDQTDMPLFDEGLGLDSIDALELGLALQKRYGVSLSADSQETRRHFASVRALADFVVAQGKA